jgi:hypothetical protein
VAGIIGTSTVTVAGTVTAACTGTQTVTVVGTSTVTVAGTSTVQVAGIVGTSTVTVAGGIAASITGTATVAVVGTSTVQVAGIVGTSTVEVAGIVGTSTVTVAGGVAASITGTATVEVAGIIGTSTVTVSGTVTVACTGTQTVTVIGTSTVAVVGTSTVEVAGIIGTSTVQVAGIVGTSTVTVAGGVAASITGTATVTVVGTSTVTVAGTSTIQGQVADEAAFSGNPVTIAGVDNAGNVELLPVSAQGDTMNGVNNVLIVGGVDGSGLASRITASSPGNAGDGITIMTKTSNALADGATNSPAMQTQVGGTLVSQNVLPMVFNGTTWDRNRSGAVLGSTMIQVTSTPTVNIAGLFTAQTNTTTITASSTLAVAAATRWEVKAINFLAICSNTVTKQAAIWITDASGRVIWETQGPVVTPTNTLCLEHTLYPAVTSQTAYTPLVRGTSTSVIILSMPDLVLGASFTINATMVGAAATQTYTLVVNAIIE